MRIMICDDEKNELEKIKKSVSNYVRNQPDQVWDIQCFTNPFMLLDAVEAQGAPDIVMLDICMPGLLGTEVARELQKRRAESTDIIFLTTSADFAVEAFALHVDDYLKKPYTEERLFKTLDRVVQKRKKRVYAPIQCGKETCRIDLYSMLYAESCSGEVEIHLNSGSVLRTRCALSQFSELFEGLHGFAAVGASYLVNFRWVHSVKPTVLEMTDGARIPVPRRIRSVIKEQYFDFYMGEARRE